jgi:hypothetical protein
LIVVDVEEEDMITTKRRDSLVDFIMMIFIKLCGRYRCGRELSWERRQLATLLTVVAVGTHVAGKRGQKGGQKRHSTTKESMCAYDQVIHTSWWRLPSVALLGSEEGK